MCTLDFQTNAILPWINAQSICLRKAFFVMKWIENEFLAKDKNFTQLKSHFLSFSQANMNFLAWDENFCLDQKTFCPGQF